MVNSAFVIFASSSSSSSSKSKGEGQDDDEQAIGRNDFKRGLVELGIELDDSTRKKLRQVLDRQGGKTINYTDFEFFMMSGHEEDEDENDSDSGGGGGGSGSDFESDLSGNGC